VLGKVLAERCPSISSLLTLKPLILSSPKSPRKARNLALADISVEDQVKDMINSTDIAKFGGLDVVRIIYQMVDAGIRRDGLVLGQLNRFLVHTGEPP
jgi:hypothetical protein